MTRSVGVWVVVALAPRVGVAESAPEGVRTIDECVAVAIQAQVEALRRFAETGIPLRVKKAREDVEHFAAMAVSAKKMVKAGRIALAAQLTIRRRGRKPGHLRSGCATVAEEVPHGETHEHDSTRRRRSERR